MSLLNEDGNIKNSSNRYEQSSYGSEQNQFIKSSQKLLNYQTVQTKKNALTSPISIIVNLEQQNRRLKAQVDRIEKVLQQQKVKVGYGLRLPQISAPALKKQLQNAYKQIKQYEYEISKRQMSLHEGEFVEMIRRAEQTLKQRQNIAEKIRKEITQIKRQSKQLNDHLEDNHLAKQYAARSTKLHHQIKYYECKIKQEQQLQSSIQQTADKRKKYIQNLEIQLLTHHYPKQQLMKLKAKYQTEKRIMTGFTQDYQSQTIQRTSQAYEARKVEINILQKMQGDYAKQIDELQNQKKQYEEKATASTKKLQNAMQDLNKLQLELIYLKKYIDPSKIKPIKRESSVSLTDAFGNKTGTSNKPNVLEHQFQTVEIGQLKKKSKIVNDRVCLGKKSAKIVQLTLYQNRSQFLGFQATYLVGETLKKGSANILKRENQRKLTNKNIKLENGDYFKTFQCSINSNNIIIGLVVVSVKGTVVKAGDLEGFRKQLQMNQKQYPCCLYGAFSEAGFQLFGLQKVENE